MSRPAVLFLHANGFPAGAYTQFLTALSVNTTIHTLPVINTPLVLQARKRWPSMVQSVSDEIKRLVVAGQPLSLVGHSMGGYLSLLAGARLTEAVAGVVLIDSPLVTGWRGSFFTAVKATGLSKVGGPAPIAARRRNHWPSSGDAQAHLAGKAFAKRWAPGVLEDFIAHGLTEVNEHPDHGPGVMLRIAREIERDIYANLPARAALGAFKTLRNRGIPVSAVAGQYSQETNLAGRAHNRRLFGKRWHELPAGHLIPMEQPGACAKAVAACLASATAMATATA